MFVLAAAALSAVACGGGSQTTGDKGGERRVLRVGTTYYADTLNPLIGIETQDTNVYVMVYPQLVQYGPGFKLEGDWAKSWSTSEDGLTWTFQLRTGGEWSDGTPLTAEDAVWTINTILRYKNGPTSYLAGSLAGVENASAPDDSTLVLRYEHPVAAALPNLEQIFILPKHVWSKQLGKNGRGLKTYQPQRELPLVAGGAYTVTQFEQKGTTVFKPNPGFYGPRSHAAAVTLTYYTNPTSMSADLENGNIDFVDALPTSAAKPLANHESIEVVAQPGSEVTNLGFNSNPLKPKNRELLDPRVKEALEYATPRQQIADVVFSGYAKPWANILNSWAEESGWLNPDVQPLPYDLDKANAILDTLGYARGSDGIRVAPATTGRYAQEEHPMRYGLIVPKDLNYNGDRLAQLISQSFAKVGVKVTEVPGGDGSQAYTMITAPKGKYLTADMYTWYWNPYVDPNFNLSVVTKAEWYNNSDSGFDDPKYDRWYRQQARLVDPEKRRALVWKMEAYLAEQRPYIQLVNVDLVTARSKAWTGFHPTLNGYCKCYYTDPRPVQ